MKIGIISINAHTKVLNFASPLHSYAFWSFLNEHGIESEIIDYKPVYYGKFDPRHPLFYYIDHPRADAKEQQRTLKKWKNLFWEREKRYDRFEEFINKYYVKTNICYTAKSMETKDPGYDCYICATDVIWKWNPNNGFDKGFLLACKCMEGKHKIAYAASRGATTFSPEQEQQFQSYINDIDFISVREKSLQEYCQKLTDKPVTHVLDPVFLKDRKFYEQLAIPPKERGYVLIYVVMEKAKSLVTTAVNFAKKHNLKVIELGEDLENRTIPKGTSHDVIYDIGIEEWLGYIQHADYIFTNSFHACCFSVIFQKEFWAGKRSGDKIDSILKLMDLENRRVGTDCEDGAFTYQPIPWERVYALYDQYRRDSEEFILHAIHACEQTPKPQMAGSHAATAGIRKTADSPSETTAAYEQSNTVSSKGGTAANASQANTAVSPNAAQTDGTKKKSTLWHKLKDMLQNP